MLEQASPLRQSMLNSALGSQSRLRPNGSNHRKKTMASIMLTSLVDAFSILVIFLIMNHANSQEALEFDNKNMTLPRAEMSQVIQNGVVVKIVGDRYTIDKKEVSIRELAETLQAAMATGDTDKKKDGLIFVADKKLDFADLSPVMAVGSQLGFSKYKFVVERKD